MKIIDKEITIEELKKLLGVYFDDMVKCVVDIEKECLAIDAELHSDLESYLLDEGSKQSALWGINLFPNSCDESFIVFDSVINIKPNQNNRSRDILDANLRNKIIEIVKNRVLK
jgi:hypothetical protein